MTVTFPFILPGDIAVSDGAVLGTLGSDYTVSGGGYNGSNQMQTGSITVTAGQDGGFVIGDTITIYRSLAPTQTTNFTTTGILTPIMTEQDDDKLTCLVQELLGSQFNPFPPIEGAPNLLTLGWITADSGGIKTSIDSLNVTGIPANELPLFIAVSIADDLEIWKLRPMQVGDPSATTLPGFVVPVTNPNSLIWVLVSSANTTVYTPTAASPNDYSVTSTTTPVLVTGMGVNLPAIGAYTFQVNAQLVSGGAGGFKFQMGGTVSALVINWWANGILVTTGANHVSNAASMSTANTIAATGDEALFQINGTILVDVPGTLEFHFAQATSNGTASSVTKGSWITAALANT